MTSARNVSILEGQTGSYTTGGREYLTYYDGRNLQRLAFTVGGVTYWVSSTLENDLSAKTIEEIAKSMRPLNRARLKKGAPTPTSRSSSRAPRRDRGAEGPAPGGGRRASGSA